MNNIDFQPNTILAHLLSFKNGLATVLENEKENWYRSNFWTLRRWMVYKGKAKCTEEEFKVLPYEEQDKIKKQIIKTGQKIPYEQAVTACERSVWFTMSNNQKRFS